MSRPLATAGGWRRRIENQPDSRVLGAYRDAAIHPLNPIMPNWCQNHLTVTGATPESRAWLADHGFSFEKMNPPRSPRKAKPFCPTVLENHYKVWGTKWDLDDTEQKQVAEELLDSASAFFDTT